MNSPLSSRAEFGVQRNTGELFSIHGVLLVLRSYCEKHRQLKRDDGPGRNDHCPCGSGRKYKHCHGRDN